MNTESQIFDERYPPSPSIKSAVNNLIEIFNEAASLITSVQQKHVLLKSKYEENELQLEDTQKKNQDLSSKLIIIEEKVINYEEQIEQLKKQYDENIYNIKKVDSIKSEHQQLKDLYESLKNEFDELTKKNEFLSLFEEELIQEREKGKLLKLENQNLNDKINELIESQKNQSYAKDEIVRKNFEINSKIEEIENLKIKIADLQNIIFETQRQKNEIETEYSLFKENIDSKKNQTEITESPDIIIIKKESFFEDNETLKFKLKEYESEIKQLNRKNEELKEQLSLDNDLSNQIRVLESQISVSKTESDIKENQINYLSDKLNKLQEQINTNIITINSKDEEIQKLNQNISSISANKLIIELNEKDSQQRIESLQKEITNLKKKNSGLEVDNDELKEIRQIIGQKDMVINDLSSKLQNLNAVNLENEIKIKDFERKINIDSIKYKEDIENANSLIGFEKKEMITKIENVINDIEKLMELRT